MKKLLSLMTAVALVLTLAGCGSKEEPVKPVEPVTPTPTPVVESFSSNYVDESKGHSGQPKNNYWVFEGETTDGIITKLNFDVVSNKGTDNEKSLSDIYGYMMNVSDISVDDNGKLTISANGYDEKVPGAQFMITGRVENLTSETKFADLTFDQFGQPVSLEDALVAYSYLFKEYGIELTSDTKVVELLAKIDSRFESEIVKGFTTRVGFAGYNGGRTYGEQLQAIEDYILANKMTLEQVEELFKNENQMTTPISERDTVTGATIAFDLHFQNMIYTVLHGALPEGSTDKEIDDQGNTIVNVEVTSGFGGKIVSEVVFDKDLNITSIKVLENNETPTLGGLLVADDSDYIKALIENQTNLDAVETVSGTSVTSNALKEVVTKALEEVAK